MFCPNINCLFTRLLVIKPTYFRTTLSKSIFTIVYVYVALKSSTFNKSVWNRGAYKSGKLPNKAENLFYYGQAEGNVFLLVYKIVYFIRRSSL